MGNLAGQSVGRWPSDFMTDAELELKMVLSPDLPIAYAALAIEVEQNLLGRCMLEDAMPNDINPGWFNSYRHLIIYHAMNVALEESAACDVVTVAEVLESTGRLNEVGGLRYLGWIAQQSPAMRSWQFIPVLRGFALMRYRMVSKPNKRVVVRLDNALRHGWFHGKAWSATKEQLEAKAEITLCEIQEGEKGWVCYAYLRHD